jgi:LemA protein
MEPYIIVILILGAIVLILIAVIWSIYNSLVRLNERVNEAWSDITVQLKYRADLIPNVVESVKGYAKHEKEAFENVTKARAGLTSAKDVKSAAAAEDNLTAALSKIFAIAEAYPELKANQNFLDLQQQLQDVEDKIQASRRFYNNGAKDLNTKIKLFPTNVFARKLGFKIRDYFEVSDSEATKIANAPEVKF